MPAIYRAPVTDMRFCLHEIAGFDKLLALPAYQPFSPELADAIMEEAARFAAEELSPLNASGDKSGCRFTNGAVTTPAGFREAYGRYVEAGWNAAPIAAEHGGQGLPTALATLIAEMWHGSNMAFGLCPMLTQSALELISRHASDALKAQYLSRLVSGEWTGTMCMTEPDAGSDVGAIRTTATPTADSSYRIKGTKIFITYGEHDFTDNIIHMVLARLPDAPKGIKGVSLFLVPKYMLNADGSCGKRNDLSCTSIEHKMGINASPTAVMSFGENEGAEGWLVGEAGRGINAMFTMMNSARLAVGLEGIGIAGYASQLAHEYAHERVQGRMADGTAATIAQHADVRRMLMTLRAHSEALRALAIYAGSLADIARYGDGDAATGAQAQLDLLIPVLKAHGTAEGFNAASMAMQVFGGVGYIEETGISQLLRDVRVAMIYEGTNGIQALDLTQRKIQLHNGAAASAFLTAAAACAETLLPAPDARLQIIGAELARAIQHLQQATQLLHTNNNAELTGMAASPYLRLFGLVAEGYMLAQSSGRAAALLTENSTLYTADFLNDKITTAHFFMLDILAEAESLSRRVSSSGDIIK